MRSCTLLGQQMLTLSLLALLTSLHFVEAIVSPTSSTPRTIIVSSSTVVCGSNARKLPGTNICQCNTGYTGDGITCTDINECTTGDSNQCHSYANCTNTLGSYQCTCRSGFIGNGFICSDINECLQSNACDKNADCTNAPGKFTCTCKQGFTGDGKSCTDIDECTGSAGCAQKCTNTDGSFLCSCNAGYRLSGKTQCVDINECAENLHNCHKNAECSNTDGSFTCKCNTAGFFGYVGNGTYCKEDRFVAYTNVDYKTLINRRCYFQQLIGGIPIGNTNVENVYVCSKGQIGLGSHKQNFAYRGSLNNKYKVISAFWSDLDLRVSTMDGGNRLYFAHYVKGDIQGDTSSILAKANKIVADFITKSSKTAFVGTAALVATWIKATPFPSREFAGTDNVVSFQTVILTDGKKSYLIFLYEDGGMRWSITWYPVFVGYQTSTTTYEEKLGQQPGAYPYAYDSIVGNSGRKGVWVYEIGDMASESGALPCSLWLAKQNIARASDVSVVSEIACAPTMIQATFDRRIRRVREFLKYQCFETRFSFYDGYTFGFSRCCYLKSDGSFFDGVDTDVGTLSTVYIRYNIDVISARFYRASIRRSAIQEIDKAFQDCCINSQLCNRYLTVAPIPDITRYRVPRRALAYGDPHFTTMDGKPYTFNGVGDYVMVHTQPDDYNFTCHARTEKAPVNATQGGTPLGTVFSAFAFYEERQPKIEIYHNNTEDKSTLMINGKIQELENFRSVQSINETEVEYKNKSFEIGFPSGVVVTLSGSNAGIHPTLVVPQKFAAKTKGLLGNFNNIIADDFILPNGTMLDINSTEEEIFHKFGTQWQVFDKESLFTTPGSKQSFTPRFFTNVDEFFGSDLELKAQAITACGGTSNKECLFDAFATKDLSIAVQTLNTSTNFETEKKKLESFPPSIRGPTELILVFGQNVTFRIDASSNSSSAALKYSAQANGTSVTVNETSGDTSFTVNNYRNLSLYLIVTDNESGLASIIHPTLKICYCLNGGSCNFSQSNLLAEFEDNNPFIKHFACNCIGSYEGAFCNEFTDPCESSPCFSGVNCTAFPNFGNRTCGTCPQNYSGDGESCTAIDFCSAQPCQQKCTNYLGRYECSCLPGYELSDTTNCRDIDECLSSPCNVKAMCENVPGSFQCSCIAGFTGNGKDCADINECDQSPCTHNCTNTVGSFICSCPSGLRLKSGSKTVCEDVDECKEGRCSPSADCYNAIGSYLCICKAGYSGDGTTCIALTSSTATILTTTSAAPPSETVSATIASRTSFTVATRSSFTESSSLPSTLSRSSFVASSSVIAESSSLPSTLSRSNFVASSSVIAGVCTINPCKNGATCIQSNGVVTCQCVGIFFGSTCTETRRLMQMTVTFGTVILDGKEVNFSDATFISAIASQSSATYQRIKEKLEITLLATSKAADPNVEQLSITEMRIGSLITSYKLVLSNNYKGSVADFENKLNTTLRNSNNTVTTTGLVAKVEPGSVKGSDFDECQASPCHSQANCNNNELGYTCSCKPGFTGDGTSCTSEDSGTSTTTIVVSVVAAGLVLLVILLAIVYHVKKRTNRYDATSRYVGNEAGDLNWVFMNSRLRASRARMGQNE